MAGLEDRLRRLEARISPKGSAAHHQALEDYFAVLRGEEVPERTNPELDAYFAELEEYERQKERSRSYG